MTPAITAKELETLGLDPAKAIVLAERANAALSAPPGETEPEDVRTWLALRTILLEDPAWRWNFEVHRSLNQLAYSGRSPEDGPSPAWVPSGEDVRRSNIASLVMEMGLRTYPELHRWSVERREAFWTAMIARLAIGFRTEPTSILDAGSDPTAPRWLPGASLNIAESCFHADPSKAAILHASEANPEVRQVTYGELHKLSCRVANGLEKLGVADGERVALYLPMTPESVAIYLGVILAGRCAVGIADASPPPEFERRARIGGAKVVFTIDGYRRDGKDVRVYEKVVQAHGPPAVVLPREGEGRAPVARPTDVAWDDFLGDEAFEAVPRSPSDPTNILFSSGTTKDPKAIVWTHTTPIKSAADAFLHHDVHEGDVLAWPTSFGWMMGPWLTYASLVNRATMALYVGSAQRRPFGEFVSKAGVTILGVVPKLVRAWKAGRTMARIDWSRVRMFTSTAEPSTPEEMLYLMFLAGYRPVIEYCGGTEVGGGYITGTVVQPCAPATFTTPALGLDFVILGDGKPENRGEVFLIPPSIGLSNELLNYDHDREYFGGVPPGPEGEVLRRHGDQIERLRGGFYRHRGRIDDVININGVKTSSEEVRSAIAHDSVYDSKPIAVDVDGSGQHRLVIYAVPRDAEDVSSEEFRARLRSEFQRAIKERLNPLLAHVHDVVLVPELPQAGPGKTKSMGELGRDYAARTERA